MAAVESPPRPSTIAALQITGHGSATPVSATSTHTMAVRLQPLGRKLFPEVIELPKVLQASHNSPHSRVNYYQQQSISRSRTLPSTPNHSPPLLVRSLIVAPRSASRLQQNASVLRSPIDEPVRQRPATSCGRMGYISIIGSPAQSPRSPRAVCKPDTTCNDFIVSALNDAQSPRTEPEKGASTSAESSPVQQDKQAEPKDARDFITNTTRIWTPSSSRKVSTQRRFENRNETMTKYNEDDAILSTPPASDQCKKLCTASIRLASNSEVLTQSSSDKDHLVADENCDCSKDQLTPKHPSCRRNLSKEMEKELTFKPALNQNSLKIASRSTRQSAPLLCRLTERRKKYSGEKSDQSKYSYFPKINPNSIKLAQERASKIHEVSLLRLEFVTCPQVIT